MSILAEIEQRRHAHMPPPEERTDDTNSIDPVCGMTVEKGTAKHTLDVGGVTFYFCCPHCKARFAKAHA